MALSRDIKRAGKLLWLCAATLFAAAVFLALPLSNTALAYYTLDPVKITLGSSSLSLDVGATTTVSISCDMWSEEQLPGCGDAACPESCGSMVTPGGVVGGCLNEDGWCTCGGTTPVTEYTVLSVSSSDTSVATAAISGRSLSVSGRAAGTATLTITATLAKHIDATEKLTVAVLNGSGGSSAGSNSSSGSSGGASGGTTSNKGGSSASSSSAGGSVAKSRGGSGGSVSASSARRPSVQVSAAGGNGAAGSGAKGSKQQAAAAEQASANFEDADGLGGVGAALAGNGATQGAGGLSTLVARSGTPYLITIAIVVVVLAAAFFILYFYRRRRRRREAASCQASAEALFGAAEEAPQETATASGKN